MQQLRLPGWWAGILPTLVLPAVLAVVSVVGTTFAAWHQPQERPLDALATVLLLAGPAALMVRRLHPPLVFGVVAALLIGYLGAGYPFGPVFLASVIALGSTVATGHRVAAYAVTAVTVTLGIAVYAVQHPGQDLLVGTATWLAWLAALIAAAELWRARRERREQAREARAEADRRRGSEERLQIARDLHDVLGHHVSLINVQAGVALYLMDDDPEQVRAALTAIKQSSRDLLREMRSTLGVLRGVDEKPPHHPVAGLAGLDDLAAATRTAGLPVTVEISGEPRSLSPSVDSAAYRIMQEALTNARRHAGPARASVFLTYTEDGLTMRIDDDGAGPNGSAGGTGDRGSGGNGLPGMRERAAALGGTLTAGPRPGGGFRVDAHLRATADSR